MPEPPVTVAPTPPTPDRAYACLPMAVGNVDAATKEVKRLLKASLSGTLDIINEKNGTTATAAKNIQLRPADLTGNIHTIIIGASTVLKTLGPGAMQTETHLEIEIAAPLNQGDADIIDLRTEACGIMAVLWDTLSGWTNAAGLQVWRELVALGFAALSDDVKAKNYSGLMVTYLLEQEPDFSGWAP